MTAPTSDSYLGEALHNNPNAYWCPNCWSFTFDCSHLVPPLNAPYVTIDNWLIKRVAYDHYRRILELETNTRERFQHFGVPRELAVMLVKSKSPSAFMNERIDGKFPFKRVRMVRNRAD
jgi:KTSC domain